MMANNSSQMGSKSQKLSTSPKDREEEVKSVSDQSSLMPNEFEFLKRETVNLEKEKTNMVLDLEWLPKMVGKF